MSLMGRLPHGRDSYVTGHAAIPFLSFKDLYFAFHPAVEIQSKNFHLLRLVQNVDIDMRQISSFEGVQ
jgi:hypothetical protein